MLDMIMKFTKHKIQHLYRRIESQRPLLGWLTCVCVCVCVRACVCAYKLYMN